MKTKTRISNALFVGMVAVFAALFFTLMPPPDLRAGDPPKQPGLSIRQAPTDASSEAVRKAETAEVFAADTVVAPAGDEPPVPPAGGGTVVDLDWLLNQQNAIASVLFLLLTFLGKWIPVLNRITDTGKRALLVGVTVIAGFVVAKFIGEGFVWADFVSLILTYVLTALGYDKVLKPAGVKTPKVKAA